MRAKTKSGSLDATKVFILLPLLISSCSGLDLNKAKSVDDWISMCASSKDDVYCETAKEVLRNYDEPVVFLHPNIGSAKLTAYIKNRYGLNDKQGLNKLIMANLFGASDLKNGIMTSLDGQQRRVTCTPNGQTCSVGFLRGSKSIYSITPEKFNGMVYYMSDVNNKEVGLLTPK